MQASLFRRCAIPVALVVTFAVGESRTHCGFTQSFASEPSNIREFFAASRGAEVFSGPSKDYYPTAQVEPGTRLEVYHETKDGWLGVRPPGGSFSWIPASQAYLLPGGKVIEITDDGTVSWIGSLHSNIKQFRWQVKLKRGEQLNVLGEKTVRDANGNEALWYRVSPPQGEFRWVHRDQVVIDYDPSRKQIAPSAKRSPPASDSTPDSVQTASGLTSGSANNTVRTAQHSTSIMEDDVFGDTETLPLPGSDRIIDGAPIELYGDDYPYSDDYAGEIIYEDGGEVVLSGPLTPSVPPGTGAEGGTVAHGHFDGWHALDFTDAGLRLPFLSRLLGPKTPPVHDPMAHDPFNLEPIPTRTRGAAPVSTIMVQPNLVYDENAVTTEYHGGPVPPARHRPWRDPRTLRQEREQGSFDSLPPPVRPNDNGGSYDSGDANDMSEEGANYDREGFSRTTAKAQERIEHLRSALRDTIDRLSTQTPGLPTPPGRRNAPQQRPATAPNTDVDWFGVGNPSTPGQNPSSSASPYGGRPVSTPVQGQLTSYSNSSNLELEQLIMALSEMVSGPTESWNLAPLLAEARRLVDTGSDAITRGKARLLVERIEDFQRLSYPGGLIASRPSVTGASYSSPQGSSAFPVITDASYSGADLGESNGVLPSIGQTDRSRFDATGWLVLVHGSSHGNPPYALTDDQGRVVAYLSGLPGMKFDHFVNRPVGVNGTRGFLSHLQAAHIEAERMMPLDQ